MSARNSRWRRKFTGSTYNFANNWYINTMPTVLLMFLHLRYIVVAVGILSISQFCKVTLTSGSCWFSRRHLEYRDDVGVAHWSWLHHYVHQTWKHGVAVGIVMLSLWHFFRYVIFLGNELTHIAQVNSAFHPSVVDDFSTSFGWGFRQEW